MTDRQRQTIEQIIEIAQSRWPEADYISVEGPEAEWRDKVGISFTDDWWLYVANDTTELFSHWAATPESILEALKETAGTQ